MTQSIVLDLLIKFCKIKQKKPRVCNPSMQWFTILYCTFIDQTRHLVLEGKKVQLLTFSFLVLEYPMKFLIGTFIFKI